MSLTAKPEQNRLQFLDITKGIAICLVIITHNSFSTETRQKLLFPYWIDMAVPLFMLVSGYLQYEVIERKYRFRLMQQYHRKELLRKVQRYIMPLSIAYCIEIPVLYMVKGYSIYQVIISFSGGGVGPGSYYTPVMLQIIIMFPLIAKAMSKHPMRGLIMCLAFNLLYEVFKELIGMRLDIYRLLAFRYVFFIAAGMYVNVVRKQRNSYTQSIMAVSIVIGIAIVYLLSYTDITFLCITQWKSTSLLTAFYAVPLFYVLIMLTDHCNSTFSKLAAKTGNASYSIFLTQMVYFGVGGYAVVRLFIDSLLIQSIVDIVICCCSGLLFSKFINYLTNRFYHIRK